MYNPYAPYLRPWAWFLQAVRRNPALWLIPVAILGLGLWLSQRDHNRTSALELCTRELRRQVQVVKVHQQRVEGIRSWGTVTYSGEGRRITTTYQCAAAPAGGVVQVIIQR